VIKTVTSIANGNQKTLFLLFSVLTTLLPEALGWTSGLLFQTLTPAYDTKHWL